jgi:hypothetical protein
MRIFHSAFGKFSLPLLLCLLCFGARAHGQVPEPNDTKRPDTIRYDTLLRDMTNIACGSLDPYGNIFLSTNDGILTKYDEKGQILAEYTNKRWGTPSVIDASNPMQIIVFYPAYQVIRVFNKNLIEIATLELIQLGFGQVTAVCAAADGGVWIYDNYQFGLRKLDKQGRSLLSAINKDYERATPFDSTLFFKDYGDRLVAQLGAHTLATFTPFGQFEHYQNFAGCEALFADGQSVIYLENGRIKRRSLTDFILEIQDFGYISLPEQAEVFFLSPRVLLLRQPWSQVVRLKGE